MEALGNSKQECETNVNTWKIKNKKLRAPRKNALRYKGCNNSGWSICILHPQLTHAHSQSYIDIRKNTLTHLHKPQTSTLKLMQIWNAKVTKWPGKRTVEQISTERPIEAPIVTRCQWGQDRRRRRRRRKDTATSNECIMQHIHLHLNGPCTAQMQLFSATQR